MVSRWHKNIKQGILSFGSSHKNKFKEVYTGEQRPIHIVHPTKKHTILYKPDVYFKTVGRQIYIFEILESELNRDSEIIADITESVLTPNFAKLFFITPYNHKVVDKIIELWKVIVGTLDTLYREKLPKFVAAYDISRKEARNIKSIIKLLEKQSKDDKW